MMKTKLFKYLFYASLVICMVCIALPAQAKVSVQEAERLKKDLTPLGAIRAGNEAGTIPAWTGGMTGNPEGITYDIASGDVRPDPFADEKPLYIVTAQNLDQYRSIISLGIQLLFKKYPDFEMHVYPTHRTMCAPQWVYDRTYVHATTVVLSGRSMKNAYGGVGFPIPNWETPEKAGLQCMYNQLTMWKGHDQMRTARNQTIYEDRIIPGSTFKDYFQYPYYHPGKDLAWYESTADYYGANFMYWIDPPETKGSMFLSHRQVDFETKKDTQWSYAPGTRRVRRYPGVSHDQPFLMSNAPLSTVDDVLNYNGDPVRFNWNYIETKEILVPYSGYKMDLVSIEELGTPHFPNPKIVRWELHRVHVYEAVLKEGRRHLYGRRVFYQDEDSWANLIQDKYDTRGELWRVQWMNTKLAYPGSFMFCRSSYLFDNEVPHYVLSYTVNGIEKPFEYKVYPLGMFTPNHMRRVGRR